MRSNGITVDKILAERYTSMHRYNKMLGDLSKYFAPTELFKILVTDYEVAFHLEFGFPFQDVIQRMLGSSDIISSPTPVKCNRSRGGECGNVNKLYAHTITSNICTHKTFPVLSAPILNWHHYITQA